MKFGPVPVESALGLIAAHTIKAGGATMRKGRMILPETVAALEADGVRDLLVVTLEPGDVGEDEAAETLARHLAGTGLRCEAPFTGRCNLFANEAGVLMVDRIGVDAVNGVDEAITAATLPPFKPLVAGEMVATIKIIPYAVPGTALALACAAASPGALRVAPYRRRRVGVVSTRLPSLKAATIDGTLAALAARLVPAGADIVADLRVPHAAGAVADALSSVIGREGADLVVMFGASAIADRRDVIPVGIEEAGGAVIHFGMPVDPGNLLLLGTCRNVPVIGAPGCARSPKENGFDWVLHRLLADLPVTRADIVALGVGGLLMEIVSRPQLRSGEPRTADDA